MPSTRVGGGGSRGDRYTFLLWATVLWRARLMRTSEMSAAFFHGMDEWTARYTWRESGHPGCLGAAVTTPSLPHPQGH